MEPLRIDIWSDIACPWCYVGKRRLERALLELQELHDSAPTAGVHLHWRSFELDPQAPPSSPEPADYVARLSRKYGASPEQAQGMIDGMVATAAEEGLEFRFDIIRPGNTFDAHRLLQLAATREGGEHLAGALGERLLRAYMTEGQAMDDHEALLRLALEAGLEGDEVQRVLSSEAFAPEVRRDEAEAARIGVSGVPFFLFDGRLALSGAQPAEVLVEAMRRVIAEA